MNSLPGGKGRIIFRVIEKGKAKTPSTEESKKLSTKISRDLENDVVSQYIAELRKILWGDHQRKGSCATKRDRSVSARSVKTFFWNNNQFQDKPGCKANRHTNNS